MKVKVIINVEVSEYQYPAFENHMYHCLKYFDLEEPVAKIKDWEVIDDI